MRVRNRFAIAFCLLFCRLCVPLLASASEDSPLREADSLYVSGSYSEAAALYQRLAETSAGVEKARFEFLTGKAWYRAGDLRTAERLFNSLLKESPPAYVSATAQFYLGNISFKSGDSESAARFFMNAFETDRNAERRDIYLRSLRPLFANHLTSRRGMLLLTEVNDSGLISELTCALAEKCFQEHRYQETIDLIERELSGPRTSPCSERLSRLRREAHYRLENHPLVAIMAPQSGPLASYGISISEGARLALEEFRQETGLEIEVLERDTRGTAIGAAAAATRIAAEPLSAVLGPLTSVATPGVISRMGCVGVPVLSPTASELGLSGIDDHFFQLTPPVGELAKRLGEFAAANLKVDSVAVIYPDHDNGREAADRFTAVAESLGTDVFFSRAFVPTEADFKDILMDLKESVLPDTFDTTIFVNQSGDTLETEAVPVYLKAIYLPATEAQLELIIPQVNFYKINTTFLGDEAWSSEKIRSLPELATRDVFFVDDLLNLPDDLEYNYFYNRYSQRFGHPPDLVAARAYDAAMLLCTAIDSVGADPELIGRYLDNCGETVGITGTIRFNSRHENEAAGVYWLSGGAVTREQ